jgi:predicted permease
LLLRSFEKMRAVNLGYNPENVVSASFSLPEKQYPNQAAVYNFTKDLLFRLQQFPSIKSAGLTRAIPTSNYDMENGVVVDDYLPSAQGKVNLAPVVPVAGNYFRAMDISLIHGRFFTESDKADTQLVAIVNQEFARYYWQGRNPLGKRVRFGTPQMQTPWITIVGEINDVNLKSPDSLMMPQVYIPATQAGQKKLMSAGYIVVRGNLPTEQMEKGLLGIVHQMDPQLPLTNLQSMAAVISETEGPRRFNTVAISIFAAIAVLLAGSGIYSVIAFSVASREREMAIRMALGSERSDVMRLVVISGVKLAAIGGIIGLIGSIAASALLRSLLFAVSPFDPIVLVMAMVAVVLLALAACAMPARRAASVDPMQALRGE